MYESINVNMHTLLDVTILCCFALHVTIGQLTQTPHNVATMVRHSVTLICAGNRLKWTESITSIVNPQEISTGGDILEKSRYSLNTEPVGNYSLIVTSPELNDGGQYRCSYRRISTNYGDAEVIVFESDPICKNNVTNNEAVEGDYIKYSCEVTYKGKWAPVMEWKNSRTVLQANRESKDESTGKTVKYTYITELTPEDNGQIYTCRTYFDQPKPGTLKQNEANNIPTTDNVLTKYTSPQLTVYYSPQLLVVKPEQDTYYPDDAIEVTTESNPSDRTYEWVNTTAKNGTLSKTDTITITEEMLGNQSLKVIVCNTIPIPLANTICKERRLNFTVTRKQTLTTGAIVGIALGVVTFIIILICCYMYFIRNRKHKSADEPQQMPMDSTHSKQQVPVDQVKSTDSLNPTYGSQDDLTPSLSDSVHPPTRTPKDITYGSRALKHDKQAVPAIGDVRRSYKPIQVFEPSSGVKVPVDQVKSTDSLNPTYGSQDDLTPSLNDSAHPPIRTPEDIMYADLAMMHDNQADPAIDDVPQSNKPLLLSEPSSEVIYASIQPNHRKY